MNSTIRHLQNILIFTGPMFLSLGALESQIQRLIILEPIIFDICTALGLIMLFLALAIYLISRFPKTIHSYYISRPVHISELRAVYPIIENLVPNPVASMETVKSWLSSERDVVYIVENVVTTAWSKNYKVSGLYSLFEINEKGRKSLQDNLITGVSLTMDYLATGREEVAGLYVGAITGTSFFSKGAVIEQLVGQIAARSSHRKIPLFVRPTTENGLRLTKKYGFIPCDPEYIDLHWVKEVGGSRVANNVIHTKK